MWGNNVLTSRKTNLTVFSNGLYYSEILTDRLQRVVREAAAATGLVHLILQHTTGALLLIEHEAGILVDLKNTLSSIASHDGSFHHHLRGVDENGASHVLSALFNKTLTIPILDGELVLGTYQEIAFMDFQPEQTERTIAVTLFGDCT